MTAPGKASRLGKIVGLFPELLGVGGIQEAGRLTAAALQHIAHNCGSETYFLSLNDPLGSQSFELGGRTIAFQGFARTKWRFVLAGIHQGRSAPKGAQNVVLAAHPNLALPASWMRRSAPQLKIIVMSHGIEVWKPLPFARRRALVAADIVLAPSTDTAKKLIDVQGVSANKVRRLAWPINPEFLGFVESAASLPVPTAFPEGQVVLTVGRWTASERYKGADELIRAASQLREAFPNFHLAVVGGGDDLPRLRQLALDLNVRERVHFLENLSRPEIAACYFHARVFALPSTGEGFGLVFLEAMAFAKPLVGIASGGTTDIVENRINGLLIPPYDTAALSRALKVLICDDSLCEVLGRRGAHIVRQKYQLDLFRREVERIIDDLHLSEVG